MSYAHTLFTAQCVMAATRFDDAAHGILSWHSVSRLRHSALMSPRNISDLNDPNWQRRMEEAVQHVNEKVAFHIQTCIALPQPPHQEHPSSSPRHVVSRNRVHRASTFLPQYADISASLLRPTMISIVDRVSVTLARDRAQRELEAGALILRTLRRAIRRRQGREILKSKRGEARCERTYVSSSMLCWHQ
jgi:hypothetical protein